MQIDSDPMIDLANPRPFAMAKSYPIETGLAEFFAVLREPLPPLPRNKADSEESVKETK